MAKNQNERGIKRTRETAASTSPVGVNYLLAIAIDAYENFPRLYNCVKDAKDIMALLTDKYQFEEEHIFTLFNEEATTGGIFTKFETLAGKIKPIDSLIIYFAGHGEFKKIFNEGYWIPVDARDNSVGQYIPNSEIKTMLTAMKTQHTFLIADSCFSGSLFQRGGSRNVARRRIERFPSRWGLTSGRSEIVGDGQPGENSPFAKSILYLLKNNTKELSVQEICAHVTETVAANATQTPIGEPLNIPGHQGGQFVFHLKKDEIRDWAEAKEKHTADGYEAFITMYPQGQFFDEADALFAKLKEAEEWELAVHANTVQGFLMYKKQYPDGKHVDTAIEKISRLEEEKEWATISRRNRLSDYLKYVRDYPLGKYVDEANAKIDLLDVKRKTVRDVPLVSDKDEEWEEVIDEVIEQPVMQTFVSTIETEKKEEKKEDAIPYMRVLKYAVPAIFVLGFAWFLLPSVENNDPIDSSNEIVVDQPVDEEDVPTLDVDVNNTPENTIAQTPTNLPEPKIEPERPAERTNSPVDNSQAECERYINSANSFFNLGQYESALSQYKNANDKCGSTWANLQACRDGIEYNKAKKTADAYFSEGKYASAKRNYNNALTYIRDDSYALRRITECDEKLKPAPEPVQPVSTLPAAVQKFERDFVFVAKGTFQMGSESGDDDEKPIHDVTIDKNFYMAKYEVTQELWQQVMGNNPSKNKCATCPVENITFGEIGDFIQKLYSLTGKKYRLPTEAQWEYAARGGNKNAHSLYPGTSPNACAVYSAPSPRPVGKKAPNALGIYDMAGNVAEWCVDWYDKDFYSQSRNAIDPIKADREGTARRVVRGGHFGDNEFQLRVSNRGGHTISRKRNLHFFGFRLVRR